MPWEITDEALAAYKQAEMHDRPTVAAFDELWVRITTEPSSNGARLDGNFSAADPHMKRIIAAISNLQLPKAVAARVAYTPIEGPSAPPPWLAFAIYVPDWKSDTHLLISLGRVDRHGKRS